MTEPSPINQRSCDGLRNDNDLDPLSAREGFQFDLERIEIHELLTHINMTMLF